MKKSSSPHCNRIPSWILRLLIASVALAQAAPPASWQGPGIAPYGANAGNLNLLPGQLVGTCFSRISNNDPSSDPDGFVLAVSTRGTPSPRGPYPVTYGEPTPSILRRAPFIDTTATTCVPRFLAKSLGSA